MQVGSEKLCDEVATSLVSIPPNIRRPSSSTRNRSTYMSSRGEMKMSLSEMTYRNSKQLARLRHV